MSKLRRLVCHSAEWFVELFPVFVLVMVLVICFGIGWVFGRKHGHDRVQAVLTESDFDHASELDALKAEVLDANETVMDTFALYGSCDQRTKVLEAALKEARGSAPP